MIPFNINLNDSPADTIGGFGSAVALKRGTFASGTNGTCTGTSPHETRYGIQCVRPPTFFMLRVYVIWVPQNYSRPQNDRHRQLFYADCAPRHAAAESLSVGVILHGRLPAGASFARDSPIEHKQAGNSGVHRYENGWKAWRCPALPERMI